MGNPAKSAFCYSNGVRELYYPFLDGGPMHAVQYTTSDGHTPCYYYDTTQQADGGSGTFSFTYYDGDNKPIGVVSGTFTNGAADPGFDRHLPRWKQLLDQSQRSRVHAPHDRAMYDGHVSLIPFGALVLGREFKFFLRLPEAEGEAEAGEDPGTGAPEVVAALDDEVR